ncbi:DDE-TNP-IS1595 domain-containing protein [Vairimorpha necatrix]|uniref:DDE-TNP-IS1595 domain-containing protein n=1 Tax=Vairimorpha necatrix TaxID=6039 RepID=A0AAX4JH01_9MICR
MTKRNFYNFRHPLFSSLAICKDYMIETGIINLIRRCGSCDHVVAKLTILLERGKERLVYRFQVDETVLCRRGTIRVPSRADDGIKDTAWILGLIEAVDRKKNCIVQVPDRKINFLTKIIGDKVLPGSVLISDGHSSYPGVAANLKLKHIIVNYSIGFTNEEGFHTNNIENFWSGMKSEMTKQHGVKRVNIKSWLEEFTFRKKFLNNVFKNGKIDVLIDFIKFIFFYFFFIFLGQQNGEAPLYIY